MLQGAAKFAPAQAGRIKLPGDGRNHFGRGTIMEPTYSILQLKDSIAPAVAKSVFNARSDLTVRDRQKTQSGSFVAKFSCKSAVRVRCRAGIAFLSFRRNFAVPPQLSPHISGERERLRQRTVLTYAFDEPINQRPQPRFGHVGDQIVEQAALPKQRMGSALGGVGPQMSIHTEAFAGHAE
jgi:hypothetical protein